MSDEGTVHCPRCHGRGKVLSPRLLGVLAVAMVAFVCVYIGITDPRSLLERSSNIIQFLGSIVMGPVFLWLFISRAVISRKDWYVECPRCRRLPPTGASPEDEPPGHMIETSIPCPVCGYDLRYQSVGGRCPECGSRVPSPKAIVRASEASGERRGTLMVPGITVGAVVVLVLLAGLVSPRAAGIVGGGCLGVFAVSLGVRGVVQRRAYISGLTLTGQAAIWYASCFLLFGLLVIACVVWAIIG